MITVYSKNDGFYKIADSDSVNALKSTDNNHKMLDKRGLLVSETNIKGNVMYTKEITGTPLTKYC